MSNSIYGTNGESHVHTYLRYCVHQRRSPFHVWVEENLLIGNMLLKTNQNEDPFHGHLDTMLLGDFRIINQAVFILSRAPLQKVDFFSFALLNFVYKRIAATSVQCLGRPKLHRTSLALLHLFDDPANSPFVFTKSVQKSATSTGTFISRRNFWPRSIPSEMFDGTFWFFVQHTFYYSGHLCSYQCGVWAPHLWRHRGPSRLCQLDSLKGSQFSDLPLVLNSLADQEPLHHSDKPLHRSVCSQTGFSV